MEENENFKKAKEALDSVDHEKWVRDFNKVSALTGIGYAILTLAEAISKNNKEKT